MANVKRSAKNSASRVTTLAGLVRDFDMYFNDTSEVSDANKDKPVSIIALKLAIDFIASQIFKSFVTLENPSTDFVVLSGGDITVNGTSYTVNNVGYAYYNNQIYKINTGTDVLADTIRLVLSSTEDGLFQTLDIEDGTSGSGIVDYADIIYLSDNLNFNIADSLFTFDGDFQTAKLQTGIQSDLSDASLTGETFSTSSQSTGTKPGICMSRDGTKVYAIEFLSSICYQYNMSTAFDLSTMSYSSNSFDFSSEETAVRGCSISSDGSKFFIIGVTNNVVFEYDLGTNYDISSAVKNANEYDATSEVSTGFVRGFSLSSDGTKMFIACTTTAIVHQYTLSTAWDVSSVSYDSVTLDTSTQTGTSFASFTFSYNGLKAYALNADPTGKEVIFQYDLSTAWDISTASYNNVRYFRDSGLNSPDGIVFGDGKMFTHLQSDVFYEYIIPEISKFDQLIKTTRLFSPTIKTDRLSLLEQSADPADPPQGSSYLWQSDGTGSGDDGDIMIKINSNGTVKTATIIDYSAI